MNTDTAATKIGQAAAVWIKPDGSSHLVSTDRWRTHYVSSDCGEPPFDWAVFDLDGHPIGIFLEDGYVWESCCYETAIGSDRDCDCDVVNSERPAAVMVNVEDGYAWEADLSTGLAVWLGCLIVSP